MSFAPDPRIEAASVFVADLPLCQVRLQDDRRWPWLVLMPRGENLVELADLSAEDRGRLIEEATRAGGVLRRLFDQVAKLNLGALGNIVPQLHVHVVGRWPGDPAWPGPVWGAGTPEPYGADLPAVVLRLQEAFRP